MAMSAGNIISSPVGSSNCVGPLHCFTVHVFSMSSRKYSFEKVNSDLVHGPLYPERVV